LYSAELLAPCQNLLAQEPPLLAVYHCLLNIFTIILPIWMPSPLSTPWLSIHQEFTGYPNVLYLLIFWLLMCNCLDIYIKIAPVHNMKVHTESRIVASLLLTSVLDGGKSSTPPTIQFTSTEITPLTHWKGGWLGPRASLDLLEKTGISYSCQETNLVSPSP
jgi:hypothetical protein